MGWKYITYRFHRLLVLYRFNDIYPWYLMDRNRILGAFVHHRIRTLYIWFFNFNVRVHRYSTSSYERHCSKKASPERKETGIYTYLYSILHTRAPVILGQVRNRWKHNSPIKKEGKTHLHTDPIFPTAIAIPNDDRRRLRFEEGRLLFLISGARSIMKAR